MINSFLTYGLFQISILEENYQERKEELLIQYEACLKLPRKKKKKVKKHLQFMWSMNESLNLNY